MTDYIIEASKLSKGQNKLIGLYQEMLLSQDQSGGVDGMWFDEATQAVMDDTDAVLAKVSEHFKVTESVVRKHCGL